MYKRIKDNIKNRIGERKIMNCGEEAEIVEYVNSKNVKVKFIKTGEIAKCGYKQFLNGQVKSSFTPSSYGVGIVGLEKTLGENKKQVKSYITWQGMLERCYSESYQNKHPTYKNCTVCDEWLYYKNFKQWYEDNYYEINNETMHLDKDILVKGNKAYSPETCVFVPQSINALLVKNNAIRGDLPIGVSWHEQCLKYRTRCGVFDINTNKKKSQYLGLYNTPQEAFQVYKKAKEKNIKLVADYYKGQIPKKLYDAMYKYEVEITD